MFVNVKQDEKSVNKAAYSVLGVDMHGHKHALGLWIRETEGVAYWMIIFDELRARGLRKVTDGKGAFSNDDSIYKALYLRICDIRRKWTMPVPNWAKVLYQTAVMFLDVFGERTVT